MSIADGNERSSCILGLLTGGGEHSLEWDSTNTLDNEQASSSLGASVSESE